VGVNPYVNHIYILWPVSRTVCKLQVGVNKV